MSATLERATPVEAGNRARRRRLWLWALLAAFLVGSYLFWRIVPQTTEEHREIREHFKYGSIGADNTDAAFRTESGKRCPKCSPNTCPAAEKPRRVRRVRHDHRTGCRAADRVLEAPGVGAGVGRLELRHLSHRQRARDTRKRPQVVLGMPSNTVDLQAYFRFLFACAGDGKFTVENVMAHIKARGGLDWYERLAYPRDQAVPRAGARAEGEGGLLGPSRIPRVRTGPRGHV